MLNFILKQEEIQIYRFTASLSHQSPISINFPAEIHCRLISFDPSILETISKNESLKYSSVEYSVTPEFSQTLAQIALQIPLEMKYAYLETASKSRYLVAFQIGSEPGPQKVTSIKLTKLPVSQNEEANLEPMDKTITDLERQLAAKSDRIPLLLEQIDKGQAEIEEQRKVEAKHNQETDLLYRRIKEVREKLTNNSQVEETVKEKYAEKERLSRTYSNLTKEQAIQRQTLLEKMAKKYEDLRVELIKDAEEKIQVCIDKEKKLKAILKASMQKQVYQDKVSK